MSKIDHSLFSAHEHALEEAFGTCPLCDAKLKMRHGKSGAFIGCSRYPECDFSKSLHETQSSEVKQIEGSACPECSALLAIKKGRYGLFIGCTNFPDCHHIESLKQHDDTKTHCPQCTQGHLVKRANKFGKSFYACSEYPKCKYALNHQPVEKECPECAWPIMQQRQTARDKYLQCPQKSCGFKVPLE